LDGTQRDLYDWIIVLDCTVAAILNSLLQMLEDGCNCSILTSHSNDHQALVGIASVSSGDFYFIKINTDNGIATPVGSPIDVEPFNFTVPFVGPAINPETGTKVLIILYVPVDTLWFMGQQQGQDTLYSIDLASGSVASSVTLHVRDVLVSI
jgi:hypothetical protein